MIDIKNIFLLLEADKPIYFAILIMQIFFYPVIHGPHQNRPVTQFWVVIHQLRTTTTI